MSLACENPLATASALLCSSSHGLIRYLREHSEVDSDGFIGRRSHHWRYHQESYCRAAFRWEYGSLSRLDCSTKPLLFLTCPSFAPLAFLCWFGSVLRSDGSIGFSTGLYCCLFAWPTSFYSNPENSWLSFTPELLSWELVGSSDCCEFCSLLSRRSFLAS